MESVVDVLISRDFWRGKSIFLTGHTGFKGGWLASWLADLGANVCGYALNPETNPSFFTVCDLEHKVDSVLGDIGDAATLSRAMQSAGPEIVFHLAAQPLVRRSYREPAATFATNVIGTVNFLEAVRATPSVKAVVIVTSDKCYENGHRLRGYREGDPLGGHDPYSASKACAEIVCAAYRRSYFGIGESQTTLATARAGNVIGWGDWAEDRLVPDAMKAFAEGTPLLVRNPRAVRPWQHVLEPLAGYLVLAERLYRDGAAYAGAWNFGPRNETAVTVSELADTLVGQWGHDAKWQRTESALALHESSYLKLDYGKAHALLGWRPCLGLEEAVEMTVRWYREAIVHRRANMYELSRTQMHCYEQRMENIANGVH
jgi:CDP-glucose 4,6-dehydratase